MPRFSVIVVARKVQACLREGLASVLSQSYRDIELIAVDDGSPDGCGEIIDETAAHDTRVRAIRLPQSVGPGPARNAAIERASGDYLLVLDGDDTLAPGSLRAIADRLKRTGDPDVLVFGRVRIPWDGEAVHDEPAGLLADGGPQPFTLAGRPELLRLPAGAKAKAYRREFVTGTGLAFPPGAYEEIPWCFQALLTASSIALLDRVCLHEKQPRVSRLSSCLLGRDGRPRSDIFEQYDRVFAFLAEHPQLSSWHLVLFHRMLDDMTAAWTTPDPLPRTARRAYLGQCAGHYRRHRPASGARSRVPFMLRWRAGRVRRWAGVHGPEAYKSLRAGLLRVYYRIQRLLPLDRNLAVFAAYWNKGYSCNPAAIEAAVRRLAPHIRTAWITSPEYAHTLPDGVRRLHPGSAAFWKVLARATYFVNNVNFTYLLAKRPGQIHLQTHHGTPLKTMGLDLLDHPAAAAGTDFDRLLNHVDRWDYSLTSNRHSTLSWERAYPAAYTTLEYGYPRNDVFQRATADDVSRIRATLGIPSSGIAILYAPTHRDYSKRPVAQLDLGRLARALGPEFTLLTRSHYFYQDPLTTDRDDEGNADEEAGTARIIDVSAHPSVEELCLASDALLTDYSSVMFDYANLDRPIVILATDWETYRAARGTYFDITSEPPGPVARTEEELIGVFTSDAWHGPRSARLRAAFRARFCPYDDGNAAERVVRRVFLAQQEDRLPPVVPLDERRPAPPPSAGSSAPE
ncbi:bifunctional glycosyltransferase family 2 protein/CDP-glycerol:glycerophosphate glycerophosphotransferase [Streptomyces sp. RB6PN25]|uniref:Bifunctional glycosyltransferase family 2 protein/CDP-glycerol:glycerophosphate glycerophosphotransferase n=1 Tax=Streptomyces humicola TaxID=2953240 RepID=A0ABT1Q7V5_9ACTN|nr:bifunctional glycosyltransferase family 2 protein/CDP-glycerol:glycerophosphate glycerophosphotransferase [Streptomyces humicola]MCQ4084905.1 bifunctional glycosyltransferase family 2 protein/CDP-glycerol:glycerophosphate glycerophosphotransferase [Streptomyces humicola]